MRNKKFIPLLLTFFFLLLSAGSSLLYADQIALPTDQRLIGTGLRTDGNILFYDYPKATQPLQIHLNAIDWLAFSSFTKDNLSQDYPDKIVLKSGDILPGKVIQIEPKSTTISFINKEPLSIPHHFIRQIFLNASSTTKVFNGAQNLTPLQGRPRPIPPNFLHPYKLPPQEPETIGQKKVLTSPDRWKSTYLTGWKWVQTPDYHQLEIPNLRSTLWRNIPYSKELILQGTYIGPTPENRKKRLGLTEASKGEGILLILGNYDESNTDPEKQPDLYALSLEPDKVTLYRQKGKIRIPIIQYELPKPSQNYSTTQYDFQLNIQHKEIGLNINGTTVKKVIDTYSPDVELTRFSVKNTEYFPIVLRNLEIEIYSSALPDLKEQTVDESFKKIITTDGDIFIAKDLLLPKESQQYEFHLADGNTLSLPKEKIASFIFNDTLPEPAIAEGKEPNTAPVSTTIEKKEMRIALPLGGYVHAALDYFNEKELSWEHKNLGALKLPRELISWIRNLPIPEKTLSIEDMQGVLTTSVLKFADKDALPIYFTENTKADKDTVTFSSPILKESATFYLKNIDDLSIPNSTPQPNSSTSPHQVTLTMTNGDCLMGDFQGLTKESLQLNPAENLSLSPKREMIETFIPTQKNISPEITWLPINSKWLIKPDELISNSQSSVATISSDCDLPKQFHLSFTLTSNQSHVLTLGLWSSNPKSATPSYVYMLTIFPSLVQLQQKEHGGTTNFKSIPIASKQNNHYSPNYEETRVDVFANQLKRNFYVYLNGVLAGAWENPNPSDEEPESEPKENNQPTDEKENGYGTGLSFTKKRSEQLPIKLSQIKIQPWNGVFFGNQLIEITKNKRLNQFIKLQTSSEAISAEDALKFEPEVGKEVIQLMNGDIMNAQMMQATPDSITLNISEQAATIPLQRVRAVEINPQNPGKQRLFKEDIQILLNNNSFFTLKLNKITPSSIEGYSETLGDITIPLSIIQHIDFNLYNEALHKKRHKPFVPYIPEMSDEENNGTDDSEM